METNQQTTLIKVYPVVEWGIGAAVLIFCVLCTIIVTLLRDCLISYEGARRRMSRRVMAI